MRLVAWDVLREIQKNIGSANSLRFFDDGYDTWAKAIMACIPLSYGLVTLQNVWYIFSDMLEVIKGLPSHLVYGYYLQ